MKLKKEISPTIDLSKLTYENYILNLIKKRENNLKELVKNKKDFSRKDYHSLWSRFHGSINDLYMVLTAYNNPLSQITFKDENKKNN